jgi:hypothetical protein
MDVYSSTVHDGPKRGNNLKCVPPDEWKNKIWYIHTMDYSLLKTYEELI